MHSRAQAAAGLPLGGLQLLARTRPRAGSVRTSLSLLAALLIAAGCGDSGGSSNNGGGGGTGSADWTISGTMSDEALSGGEALGLNTAGEVTSASIGGTGEFALGLTGGGSYLISFTQDGAFAALLFFQQNEASDARGSTLTLPSVEAAALRHAALTEPGTIDLGAVAISGGQATAENNPAAQMDQDGDGLADFEDDDDDNDGIPDDLEESEEIDSSLLGFFVEDVEPNPGESGVDPDETIRIQFSSGVDPATINADTVQLLDEAGDPVALTFEFSSNGDEVELIPDSPLTDGVTYTVLVTVDVISAEGDALAVEFMTQFAVGEEDEGNDDGGDGDNDDGDQGDGDNDDGDSDDGDSGDEDDGDTDDGDDGGGEDGDEGDEDEEEEDD